MGFYDSQSLDTVERVVLAEDIKLPTLPKVPLTLKYLEEHSEYKLAFNEYTDVTGKFYLKIMTPLLSSDSTSTEKKTAPSTSNLTGSTLKTTKYTSNNYLTITIPKYIVMEFIDTIPAGTEFLMASVGGYLDTDDMKIIGIYSI